MGMWALLIIGIMLIVYGAYTLVVRPSAPSQGRWRGAVMGLGLHSPTRPSAPVAAPAALSSYRATMLIVAMSVLGVVCWVVLYGWYSLPGHYDVHDFAFDKIPDHFDSAILRVTTLLFLVISLCYALTYWLLQRLPSIPRGVKQAIVLGVAGVVIVNLLLYPVGALDVYNYIIELKLTFFYHQNPYTTTFQNYTADPAAGFAFFLNVQLFYGPVWLLLSRLPISITGFNDTQHVLLGLKTLNIVLLAVTAVAIYKYQEDDKRGWIGVFLFLANPMILFESVGGAHNDIMMTMFIVLAVLAFKGRSLLAGPLLMLSVLVKFFSASLAPLLLLGMVLQRWRPRWIIACALISLGLLVAAIRPFWDNGKMVSGLSAGTTVAQSLNSASLFSLTREYLRQGSITPQGEGLVQDIFLAIFAVSILVIMWMVWRRGRSLESGLIDTFLLFAVLVSLLTPWYLIPALALIALKRNKAELGYLLVASTLGLVFNTLSVWAWFNSGWIPFQIHLFQGLLLAAPVLGLFLVEITLYVRRDMRRSSRAARPGDHGAVIETA